MMMRRCHNEKQRSYRWYGGRGIRVTERWHDVATFIHDIERWLGPRPEGMTLDRIMNDHDYRLDNVRWATAFEQAQNRGRADTATRRSGQHCLERRESGRHP
jgi:hypothetical protein